MTPGPDPAWDIVLAAGGLAEGLERQARPQAFAPDVRDGLRPIDMHAPEAVLVWSPGPWLTAGGQTKSWWTS